MKLLLIGGLVALIIGAALTILYLSLTTFFQVHTKGLNVIEKAETARQNAAGATAAKKKGKGQAG